MNSKKLTVTYEINKNNPGADGHTIYSTSCHRAGERTNGKAGKTCY